jgi:enamine deaminase RidA (YjgF/YER057c/UK114 family)
MTAQTSPEQRLVELGITLPQAPAGVGAYRNAQTIGDIVHLAGHGPIQGGRLAYQGRVPDQVSVAEATDAARLTTLNLLASLRAEIGSLDNVVQVVHLFGMVRGAEDFGQHPVVIDGASHLLHEIFGDRGVHTRSAVGMNSLPFGIPVEIEMTVQVIGLSAPSV